MRLVNTWRLHSTLHTGRHSVGCRNLVAINEVNATTLFHVLIKLPSATTFSVSSSRIVSFQLKIVWGKFTLMKVTSMNTIVGTKTRCGIRTTNKMCRSAKAKSIHRKEHIDWSRTSGKREGAQNSIHPTLPQRFSANRISLGFGKGERRSAVFKRHDFGNCIPTTGSWIW